MSKHPLDHDQLRALAAVLRTGAFGQAAALLGVTPSAVSQRIRALEEAVGSVLVLRGSPCSGTPLGQRLAAHAEEVLRLDQALAAEIGLQPGRDPTPLRIAVNADSLATWFLDALAGPGDFTFDLVIDDQEFSADLLRRGEVSAAVTAHGTAVQGCDVWPLGSLRYLATASPSFCARWFGNGIDADSLAAAPCLTFNTKDRLQDHWIARATGQRITPPRHWIPSSEAFATAARLGIGWGMNPESAVASDIAAGRLVALPGGALDVPLFWQGLRLMQPILAPLTASVRSAARTALMPPT
jgi:LysR family transcriptional regulator, chromosome initiation inhibitor